MCWTLYNPALDYFMWRFHELRLQSLCNVCAVKDTQCPTVAHTDALFAPADPTLPAQVAFFLPLHNQPMTVLPAAAEQTVWIKMLLQLKFDRSWLQQMH